MVHIIIQYFKKKKKKGWVGGRRKEKDLAKLKKYNLPI